MRQKQTAATSAKAAAFEKVKQQRLPPLERVDPKTGHGKPVFAWASEARIRELVESAGALLWDMPRDDDCAFHMYAR